MMKNINILKTLLALSTISISSISYGYDLKTTNPYYRQCYLTINGTSFIDGAKDDMDNLRTTVNEDMQAPIMQQNIDNASAKISLHNSAFANTIKSMNDNYAIKAQEVARIKKEAFKKEMDYIKHLSEESLNEELYGFFDDDNGVDGNIKENAQSYKYFKELCKRNKMFEKISGPEQRKESNQIIYSNSAESIKKFTSFSNSLQISNNIIKDHYQKYCNAQDILSGMCENPSLVLCEDGNVNSGVCDSSEGGEEYKLANAEINSINFLNPEGYKGYNTIEDELFKTKYTYDEKEAEGAMAFAENVVFSNFIPAPSLKEKTESRKLEFVTAYNSNISMLNLAHQSFLNAYQKRIPITNYNGGDELSENQSDVQDFVDEESDASDITSQFSTNPVPGAVISSPFNPRRFHPVLKRYQPHNGVDYAAPLGANVNSTKEGVITFVGEKGGYGKTIIVDHGNGVTTLYAHLDDYGEGMVTGRSVSSNETIGKLGSTGRSTGPHLHYEIRINGVPVDPITGKYGSASGGMSSANIQMSEIDVMRYIINNFKGPDNNAAILAAKEKGVDVVKYSLMTIRNKILLNKYEQNERIESLLAGMLAYLSNSPDNVEYLKEIK